MGSINALEVMWGRKGGGLMHLKYNKGGGRVSEKLQKKGRECVK